MFKEEKRKNTWWDTPGNVAKWDLAHVWVLFCLICQKLRLWKRVVHLYPASHLPTPHLELCKRSLCHCLGPTARENEFLLNAMVTITHPSFPQPPTPFPFFHWRKENSRAAYSNKSCCLSASLQIITFLPLNCFSSLHPLCHLYRFTKKLGEKKRTIFFVKCSVSVTGFTTETFIIILIKAKRVIF